MIYNHQNYKNSYAKASISKRTQPARCQAQVVILRALRSSRYSQSGSQLVTLLLFYNIHLQCNLLVQAQYGIDQTNYKMNCQAIKAYEKDCPLDTVSLIVWDGYNSLPSFLVSSWDGFLRYYELGKTDVLTNAWHIFLEHPVICCEVSPNNVVFAGLASGDVMAVAMNNNQVIHLGCHEAPICGMFWINNFNCLMTLGYDNLIKFWSLEVSNNNFMQMELKLPCKTHTACFDFPYLVIGSAESLIGLIDVRNMPNIQVPQQYKKANIQIFSKYNCSRVNAQHRKIAMGTVDGRTVNVEFKQGPSGMRFQAPFVTRTQKKSSGYSSGLYGQVNAVDFGVYNHEIFGLIGGSQQLALYNLIKKVKGKNMSSSSNYYGAITAARLSPNGEFVAYASGTDWTKGIAELQNARRPKILLTKINRSELAELVLKY